MPNSTQTVLIFRAQSFADHGPSATTRKSFDLGQDACMLSQEAFVGFFMKTGRAWKKFPADLTYRLAGILGGCCQSVARHTVRYRSRRAAMSAIHVVHYSPRRVISR